MHLTAELASGLWQISLPMQDGFLQSVNVYLVRDADGFVLFDSGHASPGAWETLLEAFAALDVPVAAVHTIVVTHGHLDHYGMADRLRSVSGASVCLHQRDFEYMQHRYVAPQVWSGWLMRYGVPAEIADSVARSSTGRNGYAPVAPPDRLLEGGEEIHAGAYTFEVHWTPGHTPGHVCLLERSAGLLVCGDHILPQVSPNVGLQPHLDDNPLPGYLAALEDTAALDLRLGLPGHGEPMIDIGARAATLLQHQLNRQTELLSLLSDAPQSPYELASQVWRDARPNTWSSFSPFVRSNAVRTVAAHLELLVEQERAQRTDDAVFGFVRSAQTP